MSFQAHLDNIEKRTGVSPEQFIALAKTKGFTAPGIKVRPITDWLKSDYGLGHGHAMTIVKLLKEQGGSAPWILQCCDQSSLEPKQAWAI